MSRFETLLSKDWALRRARMFTDGAKAHGTPPAIFRGMRDKIFKINGAAVELRNCLTEAEDVVRAKNAQHRAIIDQSVSAGLFVVTATSPYHCKSTDAVAGEITEFVKSFETREEADRFLEATYEAMGAFGSYEESHYDVEPKLPNEDEYVNEIVTDEIPF